MNWMYPLAFGCSVTDHISWLPRTSSSWVRRSPLRKPGTGCGFSGACTSSRALRNRARIWWACHDSGTLISFPDLPSVHVRIPNLLSCMQNGFSLHTQICNCGCWYGPAKVGVGNSHGWSIDLFSVGLILEPWLADIQIRAGVHGVDTAVIISMQVCHQ